MILFNYQYSESWFECIKLLLNRCYSHGHKMFGIYKSLGQTCNPFKLKKFGKDCTWKLEINSKFTFTVA